jgi:hypothetical protein
MRGSALRQVVGIGLIGATGLALAGCCTSVRRPVTIPHIPLPEALHGSSYVTLYLMPSPELLDWSSPQSLLQSTVRNTLWFGDHCAAGKKHAIGHVNIEIYDQRLAPQVVRVGATGATAGDSAASVFGQHGLAALHLVYEGHLELEVEGATQQMAQVLCQTNRSMDLQPRIAEQVLERARKGHLSAVTFLIPDQTAARLIEYACAYATNRVPCLGEAGYGLMYGLSNRPLYGEGAGCSAFAASFIELAGLLNADRSNRWSHLKFVPLRFTGEPCVNQQVSYSDLKRHANAWGTPGDGTSTMLHIWDPDLMHLWTESTWSSARGRPAQPDVMCTNLYRSKWLVVNSVDAPTPTNAIWKVGGRDPWTDPRFGTGRFRWLCDGTPGPTP